MSTANSNTDIIKAISKARPEHISLDFERLRSEGIRHLEHLATEIWTDYNAHDPGITTMEVLCYAITDLAYRTRMLPIQDIAAGDGNDKSWFEAAEILPISPVTVLDFRKILIDLNGIRNAWIERAEDSNRLSGLYRILLEVDDDIDPRSIKQTEKVIRRALKQLHRNRSLCHDFLAPEIVQHWDFCVCLDLEIDPAANEKVVAAEVLSRIQAFLVPEVRFYNFKEMLAKGYSSDQVFNGPLLEHGFIDESELSLSRLPKYIYNSDLVRIVLETPGVLDVQELSLKGLGMDKYSNKWQIPVTLPDEQLPSGRLKPKLNACCSRIRIHRGGLNTIVSGEELEANYNNLCMAGQSLSFSQPGGPEYPGGNFREDLGHYDSIQYEFPGNYMIGSHTAVPARVNASRQMQAYLLFYDQILGSYLHQLGAVRKLFSVNQNTKDPTQQLPTLFDAPGSLELMGDFADLIFPSEAFSAVKNKLEDSINNLLALNEQLGIEKTKNPALASDIDVRIAENEKKISELNDLVPGFEGLKNQSFDGISSLRKKVAELAGGYYPEIASVVDKRVWDYFTAVKDNNIVQALAEIGDPQAKRMERRNQLLDHLIARFGETFSEYVATLLRPDTNPEDNPWHQDFNEYLQDKARFLSNIASVGAERGKGYNYRLLKSDKSPDVWNSANVSGLQKRVSALLGIDSHNEYAILGNLPYYFEISAKQPAQGRRLYQVNLRRREAADIHKRENPVRRGPLMSSRDFKSLEKAEKAVEFLYQNIGKTELWGWGKITGDEQHTQVFFEGQLLGEKDMFELFSRPVPEKEVFSLLEEYKKLVSPRTSGDREGFHLIEHILLRPDDELTEGGLNVTCGCYPGEVIQDPYSFWVTVVLPDWVNRFKYLDFQKLVEQTFRREAPAYTALRFCWVNREAMFAFEPIFKNWLEAKATCTPNECHVAAAAGQLIDWLNKHPSKCPDTTEDQDILYCADVTTTPTEPVEPDTSK